jgi:hypothetical protein
VKGGVYFAIDATVVSREFFLLQKLISLTQSPLYDVAILRIQSKLRSALSAQTLKGCPDLVCLNDLIDREFLNIIASIGDMPEQPLARERLESSPYGSARYLQLF